MKKMLKTHLLVILAILFSTFFVGKLYFHSGFPYTHDGENHLARFANYKIALKEGQFPPRFAPNLMNHYGYPVFNFNYPLANIVSLPFSLLKLNYQLTFKILAVSSLGFGLLGVYSVLTQLKVRSKVAILVSVVGAATSPFIVSLLYFRGNIGELFAWSLLPWLFAMTMLTLSQNMKRQRAIIIGAWLAFFLSHNVSVLFTTPVLLVWLVVQHGKSRQLLEHGLLCIAGLFASLWFWLPAVLEKSEVILDGASLSEGYAAHFSTVEQLFFSPLTFGFSRLGSIDSLSLSVGLLGLLTLLSLILLLLKNKSLRTDTSVIYLLVISLACLVFQLAITEPVWHFLPLVRFIQFPWRLTLLFSILTPILLGKSFEHLGKLAKVFICLVLLLQVVAAYKAKPVDYFSKQVIDYDLFAQSTTTANENLPKSFTYESFAASWEPKPVVTSSTAAVSVLSWTGTRRSYQLTTSEPTLVIEPTMVFSGWQTSYQKSDGGISEKATYVNNDQVAGRLAYSLEPGEYEVTTQFTQQTPARIVGNTVSFLTVLVVVGWLVFPTRTNKK